MDFGYDISDYLQVDSMYGTNNDLIDLIKTFHAVGERNNKICTNIFFTKTILEILGSAVQLDSSILLGVSVLVVHLISEHLRLSPRLILHIELHCVEILVLPTWPYHIKFLFSLYFHFHSSFYLFVFHIAAVIQVP